MTVARIPIKHMAKIFGRIGWHGLTTNDYDTIGEYLVTGTEIQYGRVVWDKCHRVSTEIWKRDPRIQLSRGDILVTKDGTIGKVALVPHIPGRATLNSGVFRVIPRTGRLDPRFGFWVLSSQLFIDFIDLLGVGSTINHLYQENFVNFRVPFFPAFEQRRIADYLDQETSRIDMLIEASHRAVDLLDEQMRSYIDHAIRGCGDSRANLTPTVIGGVPADWEVMHIRRVASIYSGTTFPHDYQGRTEGDYPLHKVADFALPGNETFLNNCENWVSRRDLRILRGKIIPPNSIVFPRVGAALLLNARRILTRPSLVDDNSRGLHFFRGDARYWRYLMTLVDFGRLANPGTVPTIGEEAVLSLRIPVPSDAIQQQIADSIDGHRRHVEKLRDAHARQIGLLRERRLALITAAVTGELDIAEAA